MIGLAMGLACGLAEFYLLTKLAAAFTGGSKRGLYYLLAKVALLALTLTAGVLFAKDQLVLLGVGIAAPLLLGSVVFYVRAIAKDSRHKPDQTNKPQNE